MAFLAQSSSSMLRSSSLIRGSGRQSVRTMASNAKTFVDDSIKANKVVVFSKTYCPYCTKAKSAIGGILPKEKFTVLELDNNPDVDAIQDALMAVTGGRTVPRVFVDGKFIGGGDDTARLAQSGELKKMFVAAGVL